jgi:hypothetical protein
MRIYCAQSAEEDPVQVRAVLAAVLIPVDPLGGLQPVEDGLGGPAAAAASRAIVA